jgi:hypothetical protein
MPQFPDPTPIFHITAIENLTSIARTGELLCKAKLADRTIPTADIAYQHIQGRRALRSIPISPGGTLHNYVPFYFAPRSPMLFTINQGNVPGCDYRQDDIVHLVSTAQEIWRQGKRFVFSDIHAALDYARFFDDLHDLGEIEWQIFFEEPRRDGYCIYWQNRYTPAHHMRRKETRQAEFLVHAEVPLAAITTLGVRTPACEAGIRTMLAGTGWNPSIRVVPGWYY